jgi:RNA polymerase sigma-70 factor (ECF subfamily)
VLREALEKAGETTMHLTTDEKLVARTLAGDRNAFRVLVERHYTAVYRLCRSILRHPEDAEDATQEVFLRVHTALAQFQNRGAFGAWLRRLTVNHCLNRTQSATAKVNARSHSLELIRMELNQLPASQRAALSLRLLDGLSYEEIAELMGVPVNSVRSWLHRGRARLREALQEVIEC